jgi:phage terminase Nu1 subunit (DNA packaging protein)
MAKKPSKPAAKKSEGRDADDHRKQAAHHRAQARLHEAKADVMDVKNPPKKGSNRGCYPY